MHKSTKWLTGEITVVVVIVAVLGVYRHPLLLPYQWHRLLHIFGAVLLLGNITVTAVWMVMAERTNDPAVLRFAARAVNWADVFFTIPGIFLIITNGDILSEQWGGVFKTGWIAVSLFIFLLSGVVWFGFLLRYQSSLIALSREIGVTDLSSEFFKVVHKWYFFGAAATLLPLISLAIMVFKPTIW